jgi:SLT domain-containing protein
LATQRQQTSSSDGRAIVGQVPTGDRAAIINQALEAINAAAAQGNGKRVEPTPQNLAAINLIIQRESSWKADVVNNWDSNARKGTPSKGLMQTIGPTFNSHKLPGHDNILNPVDNIIAGVRYAVKRYGSLENVPGVKAVARGQAYRGY